jgi:hypothetical protein
MPTNTTAQQTGILRGFVADSLSGEVLPYANVFIKELNRGTTLIPAGILQLLQFRRANIRLSFLMWVIKQNFRLLKFFPMVLLI